MKLLHISDLHIGKRVHEFSMIEDQKYILGKILEIADTQQADGVIIAGDVYDKAVPSAEAVQVFDWFLTGLVKLGKKVFMISGNHDSPERLAFASRLLSGMGVYVSPVYDGEALEIALEDAYGQLNIYLLPFIKPAGMRHALQDMPDAQMPESYHDAVKIAVDRMGIDKNKRNLLVAHQFVTGAGRCDSEEVSVGGIDNVDAEIFGPFDYVALGHIHSPQAVKRDTVRYCGTPLKYSFSEAGQQKSVTIVECKEKGNTILQSVPLIPLHDMRKIRGTYLEVTARSFYEGTDTEDYVHITLTDEQDIPDGLQKLRIIYPNLMRLEYDNSRTKQNQIVEAADGMEQKSALGLFAEFYELQNNQPMSAEQLGFVQKLIEGNR